MVASVPLGEESLDAIDQPYFNKINFKKRRVSPPCEDTVRRQLATNSSWAPTRFQSGWYRDRGLPTHRTVTDVFFV